MRPEPDVLQAYQGLVREALHQHGCDRAGRLVCNEGDFPMLRDRSAVVEDVSHHHHEDDYED